MNRVLTNTFTLAKETAASSIEFFKQSPFTAKALTGVDFAMQVQPHWTLYLGYTAIRCAGLAYKHQTSAIAERFKVWQEAQVYLDTKVVGLIVSQIALSALGLTTPKSVALILGWGAVLGSLSAAAHTQLGNDSEKIKETTQKT